MATDAELIHRAVVAYRRWQRKGGGWHAGAADPTRSYVETSPSTNGLHRTVVLVDARGREIGHYQIAQARLDPAPATKARPVPRGHRGQVTA